MEILFTVAACMQVGRCCAAGILLLLGIFQHKHVWPEPLWVALFLFFPHLPQKLGVSAPHLELELYCAHIKFANLPNFLHEKTLNDPSKWVDSVGATLTIS